MADLFSAASLFLLVNLVIGTIIITSRITSNRKPKEEEEQRPLVRTPSLIDRVKSINLSFHKYSAPFDSDTTSDYLHDGYTTGVDHHPPVLERAPSLLQRLTSVNFSSLYRSEPEAELAGETEPVLERAPSFLQRLSSLNFSSLYRSEPEAELAGETEPVLERAPSFLQRLSSLNFSSLYRSEPEAELAGESKPEVPGSDRESIEVSEAVHHHVKRSKSEQRMAPERKEAEKMKKSASEKGVSVEAKEEKEDRERVEQRRCQTTRLGKTTSFGDEGVDAKADEFINKFKQQLRLQRLDSLLRYRDILRGK